MQNNGDAQAPALVQPNRLVELEPDAVPERSREALHDAWPIGVTFAVSGDTRQFVALFRRHAPATNRIDHELICDLLEERIKKFRGRPASRKSGQSAKDHAQESARLGRSAPLITYLRQLHEHDLDEYSHYEHMIVPNYGFIADLLEGKLGRQRRRPPRPAFAVVYRDHLLRARFHELKAQKWISDAKAYMRVSEDAGVSQSTVRRAVQRLTDPPGKTVAGGVPTKPARRP